MTLRVEPELAEAMGGPGCPACRLLRAAEGRYWASLLHEVFQEPDARRAVRRSAGYCARHTRQLAARGDVLAAAMLADEAARGALERLAPARAPRAALLRRRRPGCPACASLAGTQAAVLHALAEAVASGRLDAAYGAGDGLCFDHVEALAEGPAGDRLRADARARLERHRRELAALIATFDHQLEGAAEEQAGAWRRALAALRGDPGRIGARSRR
jgi:hypothetical protein